MLEGVRHDGRIGIIGGSGGLPPSLLRGERREVETRWGTQTLIASSFGGREVLALLRHGPGHAVPPHRLNARAQIAALALSGAETVVALSAVGGIAEGARPGVLVLPDQFLDFTHGRPSTFAGDEGDPVVHTDVTAPYCPAVRRALAEACAAHGAKCLGAGTYVCTEGPRYESAAEIRMYRMLGGDVVGMTAIPELVLAREARLCYGALCVVTNRAAGLVEGETLAHTEVEALMKRAAPIVAGVLEDAVAALGSRDGCRC